MTKVNSELGPDLACFGSRIQSVFLCVRRFGVLGFADSGDGFEMLGLAWAAGRPVRSQASAIFIQSWGSCPLPAQVRLKMTPLSSRENHRSCVLVMKLS